MDFEFEKRWRDSQPPFDALTIAPPDYVPIPLFRRALMLIIRDLCDYRSSASLFQMLDWHEHDGYVTQAQPSSWQELLTIVASEDSLLARFAVADTYVREAFFPTERDYYLRFYVPSRYDNPYHQYDDPGLVNYGTFDATCAEPLAVQIAETLRAAGVPDMKIVAAKTFFDHIRRIT